MKTNEEHNTHYATRKNNIQYKVVCHGALDYNVIFTDCSTFFNLGDCATLFDTPEDAAFAIKSHDINDDRFSVEIA